MNMQEAKKVYDKLEETQENIPCVVSTSRIQGKGLIHDAQNYYNPSHLITFKIKMNNGKKVEVPYFGVMLLWIKTNTIRGITPKPGLAWSAVINCTDEESEKSGGKYVMNKDKYIRIKNELWKLLKIDATKKEKSIKSLAELYISQGLEKNVDK